MCVVCVQNTAECVLVQLLSLLLRKTKQYYYGVKVKVYIV